MADFTIANLEAAAKAYVDATKQLQGTFTPTVDDFTKTVCKIGEMRTLYLPHVDKLPEMNGNNLPFGETIEEFMVNDFLPETFVYESGAVKKNAKRATFAEAVYSYPLAEQLWELGVPRSQFQRVSLGERSYTDLVSSTLMTLDSSANAWNYAAKRRLLGNAAKEAAKIIGGSQADTSGCFTKIAKPSDTATGEAFIKAVKACVEKASDMNDGNLAQHPAAAAPSLTLYIKQGVIPSLEVDTLAGAFNEAKLAIPAKIKTVLDFGEVSGEDDEGIYAILVDDRGIKLHDDLLYISSDYDGRQNQDNFYRHQKQTGFISKYAYIHVFHE